MTGCHVALILSDVALARRRIQHLPILCEKLPVAATIEHWLREEILCGAQMPAMRVGVGWVIVIVAVAQAAGVQDVRWAPCAPDSYADAVRHVGCFSASADFTEPIRALFHDGAGTDLFGGS